MGTITVDRRVDAQGLDEPEPTLALIDAMRPAAVGEVIELLSSDDNSYLYVVGYVTNSRHEVVRAARSDDGWRFLIRKTH
jgi:TusA-related sulfurtransferase